MKLFFNFLNSFLAFIKIDSLTRTLISKNKLTIILYHNPAADVFDLHMQYLAKYYKFVSIVEVANWLAGQNTNFPPNALLVTFDDGHAGNYHLLPAIKKYGVRPLIYICTQIVNTRRKYWFRLAGIPSKQLKKLTNSNREIFLREKIQFDKESVYDEEPHALSKTEILEMRDFVDFGSHTCFHPILTMCTDEESASEIEASSAQGPGIAGYKFVHFAFPNGDYGDRELQFLKLNKYQTARTTDIGWNSLKTNPHRLKITGITDTAGLRQLKAELGGIPGYLYNVYSSGLNKYTIFGKHRPENTDK
jgi:peptidoglycan/xylan/chitin deacetylase (PgdA/CDA1 family)